MLQFNALRQRFGGFYAAVKAAHKEGTAHNRGHDLLHDVTVAQHALIIAPDEETAVKAWIASLCHSQDYLTYDKSRSKDENASAFSARITELVGHLPAEQFADWEKEQMHQAALRHHEKNGPEQSLVQQVLQDADRLSNLMAPVAFRIGQGYPSLPVLELEHLGAVNPRSTYADPLSCADDMRNCISEYLPQMRMPKAKTLAKRYSGVLISLLRDAALQYAELGLKDVVL